MELEDCNGKGLKEGDIVALLGKMSKGSHYVIDKVETKVVLKLKKVSKVQNITTREEREAHNVRKLEVEELI